MPNPHNQLDLYCPDCGAVLENDIHVCNEYGWTSFDDDETESETANETENETANETENETANETVKQYDAWQDLVGRLT